ncbi:hemolysin activation protein [Ectopseudomonas chengduensis]
MTTTIATGFNPQPPCFNHSLGLAATLRRNARARAEGQRQSALVVEYASKASAALEQINSHIGQISDQNIQVATATEEQSSVVEDINRNIVDIDELTVGTTHIADQLNQASSDLQALSTQLDGLVGRFRL